jgi:hypothetical protein
MSVDGPPPASHRAVHGTGDFACIVAGVEKLVAECGPRRHPVIGLSYDMDAAAFSLVDEAVALGNRLGMDYVLLRTRFFEEVGRAPTMTVSATRLDSRLMRDAGFRHET